MVLAAVYWAAESALEDGSDMTSRADTRSADVGRQFIKLIKLLLILKDWSEQRK
jgi:hypothetical protein